MAFFDKKKISLDAVKATLLQTTENLNSTIQNIDIKQTTEKLKESAISASNLASEKIKETYDSTKEVIIDSYGVTKDAVLHFDYEQLKNKDFYIEKGNEYAILSSEKITEIFKSTFEIDKETEDIVNDVRNRLPVPVETIDGIFEQCKKEAIRRAISAFFLQGLVQNIDSHSEDKYSNLSMNYKDWSSDGSIKYSLNAGNENFANMQNIRAEAKNNPLNTLQDGYNKNSILYAQDADIEHVIAKKELFDDFLLKIGTTDKELTDIIGSKENLIFTNSSFNRSLQETNIFKYLEEKGKINPNDPNLIDVEIQGKIVSVNKNDIREAYENADKKRKEHKIEAVKEVGLTVIKTGASMAIQQVVGLIIVETIDIFTDEIKNFAKNGKIINADGWLQNTKDTTTRIQNRLSQRFEERKIWEKAKSLGIESGVAGALSVIPQIIIAMITKTPAFVLSIIRESTLSTVRCVRILASNDENKLESIKIILAGTASAIVGLYVGRVISTAIAGVPLLNKFNREITDILTGLLVTAIPLVAIYTFEKNKNNFLFLNKR